MADNKAQALNKAIPKCQLKAYYCGTTPEESGTAEIILDQLDYKHRPWLIKFRIKDGVCHQFADTMGIYRRVSHDLSQILDAVIVNAKQREAVDKIISNTLLNYLGQDMAGEKDSILDPCDY